MTRQGIGAIASWIDVMRVWERSVPAPRVSTPGRRDGNERKGHNMTGFFQVLAGISVGTVVFVLGQYFLKLVLEPAVELRKVIANVATALTEYCHLYSNAGSTLEFLVAPSIEGSKNIRRLAAQLQAQAYTVVGYRLVQKFFALPPRADVNKAVNELIGLSNSFPGSSAIAPNQAFLNIKTQNQIERLLRIYNAAGQMVAARDEINGTIRLMSKRRRSFRNSTIAPSNSEKAAGD